MAAYMKGVRSDRMLGKRPRRVEVKRMNPREVKWCVDDILEPIAKSHVANEEAERVLSIGSPIQPALRAEDSADSRVGEQHTEFCGAPTYIAIKDIYKKYSAMSARCYGTFNMTTGELCIGRQCRLPSSLLGPVAIGRLLRTMRQQQKRNVVRTREKREQREFAASERERAQLAASIPGTEEESSAATKVQAVQRGRASRAAKSPLAAEHSAGESSVEQPPMVGEQAMVEEKDGDCHDTGRPLLFREFVEALVRLSYARYDSEVPVRLHAREKKQVPLSRWRRPQAILLPLVSSACGASMWSRSPWKLGPTLCMKLSIHWKQKSRLRRPRQRALR